ncbi:hypothetical protein [Actinoplanes regularis]|uniref:Dolichyl-phosphate-mannose-protein mannosyltransferase n=1 Tax=Actinoplanes regularis TaxID=52697 RepID=A0A238W0M6_9ACTN|nr:hypothetical protein [Actinoplanes regularis]GIE85367.1 membrane protein [Actinoplanes regularis]SNR40145.1 hypothetical protein SAMN06264365_10261 [Actinoplanes regularis]
MSGSAEAPEPRFGVRGAWPAIASYAVLRVLGVGVVWAFAIDRRRGLPQLLGGYDAGWYAGIVRHGYDTAIPLKPDGGLAMTNLVFFPLFPGLIAAADPVLPGGPGAAGIAISWLAGLAAAWGLYAIGAHLRDRGTGILLAALWAVLPHAFIESMGYTETLFTALAAWSLFAMLRRNWITAGLLCLLAGSTRPTGSALIAVLELTVLTAVVRRRDGWRPWVAGAVAPLGLLGYLAWVGHRVDRADGYLHLQNEAWKMSYDLGQYTVRSAYVLLTEASPLALYVVTLVVAVAFALLILLVTDRVPWQLTVYSALILAMAFFGDSYYNSKARLLIPAFPLLLPIAAALSKARRPATGVVLGLLTLVSAGYGVYLSLVWTCSP